jgi:hypothetical protein
MSDRTPVEWEGLARMAAARLYAGEPPAPDDKEALRRHPELRSEAEAARAAGGVR